MLRMPPVGLDAREQRLGLVWLGKNEEEEMRIPEEVGNMGTLQIQNTSNKKQKIMCCKMKSPFVIESNR